MLSSSPSSVTPSVLTDRVTFLREALSAHGSLQFDAVLDAANGSFADPSIEFTSKGGHISTLSGDLIRTCDEVANPAIGAPLALSKLLLKKTELLGNNSIHWHWSLFSEDRKALNEMSDLAEKDKLKPLTHRLFKLQDAAQAHFHKSSVEVKAVLDFS